MKKLFLLDAYALIYRAYYAFIKNPRINSKGFNTSAILGFVNTLEDVLKKENPDGGKTPPKEPQKPAQHPVQKGKLSRMTVLAIVFCALVALVAIGIFMVLFLGGGNGRGEQISAPSAYREFTEVSEADG